MVDRTLSIERRGGRRAGSDRVARCGHGVPYHPGPPRKECDGCRNRVRVCRVCAAVVGIAQRRYCSMACSNMARGVKKIGPRLERVCALPECVAVFENWSARVRCCSTAHGKILWNRESRADGRQKSAPWDDHRRDLYQRRRALLKGGRNGDPVMLADIAVRDAGMCGICSEPVDMSLAWPDPLSKSIDHILPVSRGGAHDPSNCQLAHLRCNTSKGDRVA